MNYRKSNPAESIVRSWQRRNLPAAVLLVATAFGARAACGQTLFTFTGGGDGVSWNDSELGLQPNWDPYTEPPAPPDDPTADVTIPSPFDVQVNGIFTVGKITIDSGAQIELPASKGLAIQPGSFSGSGAVVNNGTITVDSGAAIGNGHTTSDVTLSGSGSLVLNNGAIGPNDTGYNGRFINASNTLSGYGEIGTATGSIAFSNEAIVDANIPYNSAAPNSFTINISSDGSLAYDSYNSGTLEATNGGELDITYGTLDNTGGTITAFGNGSTAIIGTSEVNGGSLSASDGGLIQSADESDTDFIGVSIAGTYRINDHSSSTFTGTINNTGTIILNSLPNSSSTFLQGDATTGATFTGGGVIQMTNTQNDNRILGIVTNADNTIEGTGLIDCTTFTNQGTVDANVPFDSSINDEITIDSSFTNSGTIEATNGGKIEVYGYTITNTGGTFAATDGSLISFDGNNGHLIDGTLTTSGSGLIISSAMEWTNVTNSGNFHEASGSLYTDGTINNSGTILMANASGLICNTPTTFTGSGTITLANGPLQYTAGVSVTNSDNTIDGYGSIGNGQGDIFNDGTISADVPYDSSTENDLVLEPGTASTNTGTIQAANGGEMEIFRGTLTNTGGSVQAATGSTVILYGVDLIGGTVASTGSGQVLLYDGTTLDGVTLNAPVTQTGDVTLAHTITNNAIFTASSGALVIAPTNATLTGTGSLVMEGTTIEGATVSAAPYPQLTNYIPISGYGYLGSGNTDIINHAHVTANNATQALYISCDSFTNASDGTLEASGAASITIEDNSGTFTNAGTLQADSGSKINVTIPMSMTGGSFAGPGLISTSDIAFSNSSAKTGSGPLVIDGTPTFTTGATFDIGQGPVLIEGTGYDLAAITADIAAAYDKGKWDMAGITSTLAENDPEHATAVAIGDNSIIKDSTYAGQSINGSTLIVTYTWYGDANLDGVVNSADLAMIKSNGTTWSQGDFNYDGVVNADDYALFALGTAESGGANISTTLPEPTTVIALLGGLLFLRRRAQNA